MIASNRSAPRPALLASLCLLFLASVLAPPTAHASRALLSEAALETAFCTHCAGGAPTEPLAPPTEGEIEGACGLAIGLGGGIYVSDYYHRVIHHYAPFSGPPATFQSTIDLPGRNPSLAINTLDAVCGLARDASGLLYANEFHRRVFRVGSADATIDDGESTGVAIDPATNRLYVDDRTYLAEYALPFSEEDAPLRTFAVDSSADYYGLAASEGLVYVADAADRTVKVFEPSGADSPLVKVISAGFVSLVDASLAIDPTTGHLLVVDNLQPLYEHPKSSVHEFAAAPSYANLGTLPGAPVFGGPSGIAVGPSGTVFVTDGNDELANVFAYGPYQEGFAPLASTPPASATTANVDLPPTAGLSQVSAVAGPSHRARHHRNHHRLRTRGRGRAGGRR